MERNELLDRLGHLLRRHGGRINILTTVKTDWFGTPENVAVTHVSMFPFSAEGCRCFDIGGGDNTDSLPMKEIENLYKLCLNSTRSAGAGA